MYTVSRRIIKTAEFTETARNYSRKKHNLFFYVHGTVYLGNTSFIKYQRDATFSVYLVFYNSTCFGRSLRPSSGVIVQTVVAATGVNHRCGVE